MKRPCLLTTYFKAKSGEIIAGAVGLKGVCNLTGKKSPIEELKSIYESAYGEIEIVDENGNTARENGYHRADTKQIYLKFWLKEVGKDNEPIQVRIKTTPYTALRDSDKLLLKYQSMYNTIFEFLEVQDNGN